MGNLELLENTMLSNQAHLFDLEEEVTYINGAFMSPQLKSVTEIGHQQLDKKARPYQLSVDDFFRDVKLVKEEFAKVVNAPDANRIAIIPSVSYGMANVVKNVDVKGKDIVVVEEQFPSNIYPWMELEKTQGAKIKLIKAPDALEGRGKAWNEKVLEAIDSNTGMVALSHVHWADGTLFDLKKIREKTCEVGALLVIDGTQSVGAYPFDVNEIDPDALICAGYKWLLGPYGIGVAYYGPAFDKGTPFEQNWINRKDSENFAGLVNYKDEYQPGAFKYSMGEQSNFILIPMFLEALKQINRWGVANVQAYCEALIEDSLEELKQKGYWVEDKGYRASHLFGIRKEGLDVEKLKKDLDAKKIYVSIRGSSVRVAPSVYNSKEEFQKLVSVL